MRECPEQAGHGVGPLYPSFHRWASAFSITNGVPTILGEVYETLGNLPQPIDVCKRPLAGEDTDK